MLTRAQAKAQRRALMRDIAREERRRRRVEMAQLRLDVKELRRARRDSIRQARSACRLGRKQARERARSLRAELLAELRARIAQEKAEAQRACALGIEGAKGMATKHEQARAKLEAERQFRRDMRRIEAGNRARRKELTPKRVRGELARESDDEVRANIPPELLGLFERVKSSIKASGYRSRTEAFLHYAEEHPGEVLEGIEDRTDAMIREYEQRGRRLAKAPTRAELEEIAGVPF